MVTTGKTGPNSGGGAVIKARKPPGLFDEARVMRGAKFWAQARAEDGANGAAGLVVSRGEHNRFGSNISMKVA